MNVIEGDVKNIEQMENCNLACRQSQKGGFDSCDDIVTIKKLYFFFFDAKFHFSHFFL
jgi:hypothetical protein